MAKIITISSFSEITIYHYSDHFPAKKFSDFENCFVNLTKLTYSVGEFWNAYTAARSRIM